VSSIKRLKLEVRIENCFIYFNKGSVSFYLEERKWVNMGMQPSKLTDFYLQGGQIHLLKHGLLQ